MSVVQILLIAATIFAGFAVYKERSLASIAVLFLAIVLVVQAGAIR